MSQDDFRVVRLDGAGKTAIRVLPSDLEAVFVGRMMRERERQGLSQAGVVELVAKQGIDLHPTAITKLERLGRADRRSLRLNEAVAIAAALGLTLGEMLADADMDPREQRLRRATKEVELLEMVQAQTEASLAVYKERLMAALREQHELLMEEANRGEHSKAP